MFSKVRLRASNLAPRLRMCCPSDEVQEAEKVISRPSVPEAVLSQSKSCRALLDPDEASGTTWHCDGRTFEFFRNEVSKGREGGSQRSFSFFSLFARSFISFSRAIFTIPLASS